MDVITATLSDFSSHASLPLAMIIFEAGKVAFSHDRLCGSRAFELDRALCVRPLLGPCTYAVMAHADPRCPGRGQPR